MTASLAIARREVSASGLRRFFNAQDGCWHVQLTQGDTYATGEANEVLTTVLGSCVAACIRDPFANVGGMNHFLLPEGTGEDRNAVRYGVNAMELLINGLLKRGATRSNLQAKLFGGANVIAGLSDVGTRNAVFAQQYLVNEGIPFIGGSVGGNLPRRVRFWPLTGRAAQLELLPIEAGSLGQQERDTAARLRKHVQEEVSDVELF